MIEAQVGVMDIEITRLGYVLVQPIHPGPMVCPQRTVVYPAKGE